MKREDIQARRDYHHSEAGRARTEAQECLRRADDHEAKVRAYDLVLQDLAFVHAVELQEGPVPDGGSMPGGGGSSFIDWVRKAVAPQEGTFAIPDVRGVLDAIAPGVLDGMADRNALSKALSRMADTGEIYILRKGQGKRPALYSKKNPALSPVALGRFVGLDEADDDRPEEEVNDNSGQVSDRVPTSG